MFVFVNHMYNPRHNIPFIIKQFLMMTIEEFSISGHLLPSETSYDISKTVGACFRKQLKRMVSVGQPIRDSEGTAISI